MMRIKKRSVMTLILVMMMVTLPSVHASNTSKAGGTNVGVGFIPEESSQPSSSNTSELPTQPKEVKLPKTGGNSLPQLGQLIEPMTVLLLGLVIWLVVLSIMSLTKYLQKEDTL